MKPPIFVLDRGSLDFFETAADVEAYLEPIDVASGVYRAFDSGGRVIELSVERIRRSEAGGLWKSSREVVRTREGQDSDAAALFESILAFLTKLGRAPERAGDADLSGLVALATREVGFTK